MNKLPEIDSSVKIVNKLLQPYFEKIGKEIMPLNDLHRHKTLREYKRYLENEAQKTRRLAVRLQIRINLAALLERFDYNGPKVETNVYPTHVIGLGFWS